MSGGVVDDKDPNHIFKDRFANVHSKNQIEKQREFDACKIKLQREFEEYDRNGDGTIDKGELEQALRAKVSFISF